MERPTGVILLAVLYTAVGLYWILSGVITGLSFSSFGGMMGGMFAYLGALGFLFGLVVGLIHLAIASALFSGKNWGRQFAIFLAVVGLILSIISLLFGDIISLLLIILDAVVIYYLRQPQVRDYFNREEFPTRKSETTNQYTPKPPVTEYKQASPIIHETKDIQKSTKSRNKAIVVGSAIVIPLAILGIASGGMIPEQTPIEPDDFRQNIQPSFEPEYVEREPTRIIPPPPPEPIEVVPTPEPVDIKSPVVPPLTTAHSCSGYARCVEGVVTEVNDGDTIHVSGQSIRFTLTDAPEYGEDGYWQARDLVERICPIGSSVLVDEDDGQTEGSYGRIIGVAYCNGRNLNEAVLDSGYGQIYKIFCDRSEFGDDSWAQRHGCRITQQEVTPPIKQSTTPQPTQSQCDPSYPTVCIPPPPPDLDCKDVKPLCKFKVIGSDPHRFDSDGDGVGCESC